MNIYLEKIINLISSLRKIQILHHIFFKYIFACFQSMSDKISGSFDISRQPALVYAEVWPKSHFQVWQGPKLSKFLLIFNLFYKGEHFQIKRKLKYICWKIVIIVIAIIYPNTETKQICWNISAAAVVLIKMFINPLLPQSGLESWTNITLFNQGLFHQQFLLLVDLWRCRW